MEWTSRVWEGWVRTRGLSGWLDVVLERGLSGWVEVVLQRGSIPKIVIQA